MNNETVKEVRRKIKNLTVSQQNLDVNEIRVIVALERAIARVVANKELSQAFVFKGGFVLFKDYHSDRFTRDIDALASNIQKEQVKSLVSKALQTDLDDGLWYGDIQVEELDEQGEYGTYRFDMAFQIGEPDLSKIHKLSRMHFDVGFSDRLAAPAVKSKLLSILPDSAPISWSVYPVEQIVAEKLQTLFERGSANSRAKDIYDLNYLLPKCTNHKSLMAAIRQTFKNRSTDLPENFVKEARAIDRDLLTSAWGSVQLIDSALQFDEVWKSMMVHLKRIDDER